MNPLDCAILLIDLPEHGLVRGDVGTIVHVHHDGEAFEVEFLTLAGRTIAIETVGAADLRAVDHRDVSHSRALHCA